MKTRTLEQAYRLARERYAEVGVDCDRALKRLARVAISVHCWQGDDIAGFERAGTAGDGGLQVTGSYPGRARSGDELRQDLEQVYRLIPGRHRLNLHAMYAETDGRRVERNELAPEHFGRWMDWARQRSLGLDFNPTFFAHPRAASGFTLSSADPGIRRFWVEHGIACRRIGAAMGRKTGIIIGSVLFLTIIVICLFNSFRSTLIIWLTPLVGSDSTSKRNRAGSPYSRIRCVRDPFT